MAEERSGVLIAAIVAIVGIVGLVILIQGGRATGEVVSVLIDTSGQAAGEADISYGDKLCFGVPKGCESKDEIYACKSYVCPGQDDKIVEACGKIASEICSDTFYVSTKGQCMQDIISDCVGKASRDICINDDICGIGCSICTGPQDSVCRIHFIPVDADCLRPIRAE